MDNKAKCKKSSKDKKSSSKSQMKLELCENAEKSVLGSNSSKSKQNQINGTTKPSKPSATQSTLGANRAQQLSDMMQFDKDEVPESASEEMYKVIFKSARNFGALSQEDIKKAEEDMKNFWKSSKDYGSKSLDIPGLTSKKKTIDVTDLPKPAPVEDLDESMDAETQALFRQAEALLEERTPERSDIDSEVWSQPSPKKTKKEPIATTSSKKLKTENAKQKTTTTKTRKGRATRSSPSNAQDFVVLDSSSDEETVVPQRTNRARTRRGGNRSTVAKKKPRKKSQEKEVEAITISDSDEAPDDVEVQEDLGKVLFFQVVMLNQRYPIRIYENQFVQDVRAMVATKAKVPAESIEMFYGVALKLEDGKTVKECEIENLSDIDAYYTEKSDKELFHAGSSNILRFKLQTSDRRGRQDSLVYVKKGGTMKEARDQYAAEKGVDPSTVKLMFDGEILDINSTPEDCDLEGDECIDVICNS